MEFCKSVLIFSILFFANMCEATNNTTMGNKSEEKFNLKLVFYEIQLNSTTEHSLNEDNSKTDIEVTPSTSSEPTNNDDKDSNDSISAVEKKSTNQTKSNNSTDKENIEVAAKLAYSKNSKIDTEVSDMLNIPKHPVDFAPLIDTQTYKNSDSVDTQILLLDDFYHINGDERNPEESERRVESAGLVPGKLAAVLAGVFLVISIAGYVVMLYWRRYLENHYGNRQMLLDDDFCQKMDDMKHFSI